MALRGLFILFVWLTHPLPSTAGIQRDYYHGSPVNDVVVHPNQGELISCDQNGSVKIWDLGENSCTHELVCLCGFWIKTEADVADAIHQVPAEDVPIRSVSIASDGGTLVAGNNKVCHAASPSLSHLAKAHVNTGQRLCLENQAGQRPGRPTACHHVQRAQ